jgi:hypothetical protein
VDADVVDVNMTDNTDMIEPLIEAAPVEKESTNLKREVG